MVHHPEYDARVGRHLEDGELIRGSVPMTKSSIRAMAIAALRLQEDSVVYDIGAGTGSVAVETAMQGGGIRFMRSSVIRRASGSFRKIRDGGERTM